MLRLEVECSVKNDTAGSHSKSPCLFTDIDDEIKWDFRMDRFSFFYTLASASVEQKDPSI